MFLNKWRHIAKKRTTQEGKGPSEDTYTTYMVAYYNICGQNTKKEVNI